MFVKKGVYFLSKIVSLIKDIFVTNFGNVANF